MIHKVILRDDDTNFFTKREDLERLIDAIPLEATMVLGVIPWIRPSVCGCVPSHNWLDSNKKFPIEDNVKLIDFVKDAIKADKISVALHGIEHNYIMIRGRFVPEFYHIVYNKEMILNAKFYLENLLECNVKSFIPPGNKINPSNYNVISNNFDYIFNVPSRSAITRPLHYKHSRRFIKRLFSGSSLAEDGLFSAPSGIIEIPSVDASLNNQNDLNSINKMRNPTTFGFATHYWEICDYPNLGRIESYKSKIQSLEKIGAKFWSVAHESKYE